jgi:hypothetical protein
MCTLATILYRRSSETLKHRLIPKVALIWWVSSWAVYLLRCPTGRKCRALYHGCEVARCFHTIGTVENGETHCPEVWWRKSRTTLAVCGQATCSISPCACIGIANEGLCGMKLLCMMVKQWSELNKLLRRNGTIMLWLDMASPTEMLSLNCVCHFFHLVWVFCSPESNTRSFIIWWFHPNENELCQLMMCFFYYAVYCCSVAASVSCPIQQVCARKKWRSEFTELSDVKFPVFPFFWFNGDVLDGQS